MSVFLQIFLIMVLIGLACSLLGPFLILQRISMMVDAISHTILLGIVLAFFLVGDLNSPLLIVGAALMGLFTVYFIGALKGTGLVEEDAAIGIVFPLLFSIGVLLISVGAGNIHLDVDTVLLGKVELAPFDFLKIGTYDLGAKSIYIGLAVFLMNLVYVLVFFKEVKLMTFDREQAISLGLPVVFLQFVFLSLVSITTVASFSAIGSILVICLMVGPAASAYFFTNNLKKMIFLSMVFALMDASLGSLLAFYLDLSIAGTTAMVIGLNFLLSFLFAPGEGMVAKWVVRKRQKYEFLQLNILFHLYNHLGEREYQEEAHIEGMNEHLKIDENLYKDLIKSLEQESWIQVKRQVVYLTKEGESYLLERAQSLGLIKLA